MWALDSDHFDRYGRDMRIELDNSAKRPPQWTREVAKWSGWVAFIASQIAQIFGG